MVKRIEIKEEYMELLDTLDDSDRWSFYDALLAYVRSGEIAELSGVAKVLFSMVKADIDKQESISRKRAEAGRKGGEKTKVLSKQKANDKQTESKQKANDKQNKAKSPLDGSPLSPTPSIPSPYNPSYKEEYILLHNATESREKNHNQRPTLDEVKAYCRERNNRVDAERFFDYYTANGWKVGKNPMKDWKAAVRTWERDSGGRARAAPREINPFLRDDPEPVEINPFLR